MLANLIVDGLCLLLLLDIVCKAARSTPEIRSTAGGFGKVLAVNASRDQASKEADCATAIVSRTYSLTDTCPGAEPMPHQTSLDWFSHKRAPGARGPVVRGRIVNTSDGVPLSVRDYGSRTAGHTVVLLHGFCLTQESWDIQVHYLIREWGNDIRIISYDHRGHGGSGSAPMHTYRIDQLAADLADLLVALGVTGSLTLAGHSMGGMTALAYLSRPAGKRPVEPQGLVLVATAAGKLAERGLGRLLATRAAGMLCQIVRCAPRAGTDEVIRLLARPVSGALTRYGRCGSTAHQALVAISAGAINATPLTTKVGFLPGLKNCDHYQMLPAITAKSIVVSGGADRFTPPSHAQDLAAGIPGATRIHARSAGHMLLHEVPQDVTRAISCAISAGQQVVLPGNRQALGATHISTPHVLHNTMSIPAGFRDVGGSRVPAPEVSGMTNDARVGFRPATTLARLAPDISDVRFRAGDHLADYGPPETDDTGLAATMEQALRRYFQVADRTVEPTAPAVDGQRQAS